MLNSLPRFQDAHDGSLSFVVAIGSDALMGFFIFFLGFFELDSVDFDAIFGVGEGCVEGECVSGADVSGFGVFG
jgi:hypothetical protein